MSDWYKFRGWDATGQKGWVYGDLTHTKKVLKEEPYLADRVMIGGYEVIPESVGLGSGILDKNGKEIFVGDIIRIYDSEYDNFSDSEVMFKHGIIGVPNHFEDTLTTLSFFFSFRRGYVQIENEDNEYTVEVIDTIFNISK